MDELINGIFVGLASITGSGSTVATWATVPIGFISGILLLLSVEILLRLRIDDPISVFPVHGNLLFFYIIYFYFYFFIFYFYFLFLFFIFIFYFYFFFYFLTLFIFIFIFLFFLFFYFYFLS